MQKATGQFTSDGLATIIDCGFVPDKVTLHLDEGTNPDIITWFRQMTLRATAIFGYLLTGSTGVLTRLTTAATGISVYDSQINGVMVDSPVPGKGKMETPISEYAAMVAASTTPTARTGAIIGTITKPSTRNGRVYECTTATGACLAEPTWGTMLGGPAAMRITWSAVLRALHSAPMRARMTTAISSSSRPREAMLTAIAAM